MRRPRSPSGLWSFLHICGGSYPNQGRFDGEDNVRRVDRGRDRPTDLCPKYAFVAVDIPMITIDGSQILKGYMEETLW